ncbi:MAG TPA: hypothetical protein VLJ83_01415 [Gemmatimonadaceae bacterium]|nr:hypothetical protein [Gemmatimonadaceae bacterium]
MLRQSILFTALSLVFPVAARAQLLPRNDSEQTRVDSAQILHQARNKQAAFERRRRQLLPKFSSGTADHCVIVGRFCEWHPKYNGDIIPDEGKTIRKARAELLGDLAKAGEAIPGDDWIIGQRIRYLTEGHDTSAVGVARSCRATRWWCDALLGLTLHVAGNYVAADSAYARALDGMAPPTRCHWMNLAPLLDDDVRGTYKKLPCPEREAIDARIWWVADPLYMVPGNERRTEHYSRVLHTALETSAANTYGSSWGGDLAELTVRFGWAEKWTQEPTQNMIPEEKPNISGHEREPGYHFFLTQPPPDSLALITDSVFDMYQFPPREQYSPTYAKGFVRLDAQVARFRRGDSTKVVAAYDVSTDTIFGKVRFAAAVIASGDDSAPPAITQIDTSPVKNVLTVSAPSKAQIIGVELLAKDSSAAARWRSGFAELPLDSARISVSDLLFVDGAPYLPNGLDDAIAHAHGGTRFRHDQKVGLFWELYGRAPADSALPISLTITPIDEGLLRRAFRALRISPKLSPINIRWQENGAAGVLSARSVMLDLSLVPPGKYAVKLEVGNAPGAMTQRIIEVM